jgi:hypothetical protein
VARFVLNQANMKVFEKAVSEAVKEIANELLYDSKMQAPVDTWAMYNSAKVDSKDLQATVSYDTEYAIYVHENLTNRHTTGSSKFLEKPLDENKYKYVNKMAETIKQKI